MCIIQLNVIRLGSTIFVALLDPTALQIHSAVLLCTSLFWSSLRTFAIRRIEFNRRRKLDRRIELNRRIELIRRQNAVVC